MLSGELGGIGSWYPTLSAKARKRWGTECCGDAKTSRDLWFPRSQNRDLGHPVLVVCTAKDKSKSLGFASCGLAGRLHCRRRRLASGPTASGRRRGGCSSGRGRRSGLPLLRGGGRLRRSC